MKSLILIFFLMVSIPALGAEYDFSDPNSIIYVNGKITNNTYTNIEKSLSVVQNNNPYIILVIKSYGGNVSASIDIVKLLAQYSKEHDKKLITYAHGVCFSICTYIFNFGEERIAEYNTVFKYHGASVGDTWSLHGTDLQITKLRDMDIDQTFVDVMINDSTFKKVNHQYSVYSVNQLYNAGIVTRIIK